MRLTLRTEPPIIVSLIELLDHPRFRYPVAQEQTREAFGSIRSLVREIR
jgi:hypothetical protein